MLFREKGFDGVGLGIAKRFAMKARGYLLPCHQALMDQAVASIGGNAPANQADSSNLARPGNSRFPRDGVDPGLAV